MQAAPREVIPRPWHRYVLPRSARGANGSQEPLVNRQAYTVCVVEHLHEALRRQDIFVDPCERWGIRDQSCFKGNSGKGVEHRFVRHWDERFPLRLHSRVLNGN